MQQLSADLSRNSSSLLSHVAAYLILVSFQQSPLDRFRADDGQGTFNSADDFAKWLAVSGATALKARDSGRLKKELGETAGAESPKSYTDQALRGGKTFASPEEFAEWMRMTKLSDTGDATLPASALTQESHEVVAPSRIRHDNPLSQHTEDHDAGQPTLPRLAPPPPPVAVHAHFNPLTPRRMVPDPQISPPPLPKKEQM
jgi:hypothetical protein